MGFKKVIVNILARVLERCGIHRRIMHLSYINWEQVDWRRIFTANIWLKLLYSLDEITLPRLLDSGDPHAAEEVQARVTGDNYKTITHDGLYLWELSKTAVLGALERPVAGMLSKEELEIVKHFYKQSVLCLTGAQKIMDRTNSGILLACQGCPHIIRPVVEEARRRGWITVATEGSFTKDYFFCDNQTGMIINRHKAARLLGDWLPALGLSEEQRATVRQFTATLDQAKRKQHVTNGIRDADEIRRTLKIPRGRKIAIFIGQVLTDASILMDSHVFPDPVALISRVVDFFKEQEDWMIVIRLHPKEANGLSWPGAAAYGGMPGKANDYIGTPFADLTLRKLREAGVTESDNVRIVSGDSINTSSLLDMADVGVTCNSQAGLEMALRYKPVVVAGDAFYGRKGFTIDVAHPSALEPALCTALSCNGLNADEKMWVDRFVYYLLNDCMFRRDFKGQWGRLFRVFDGCSSRGLRGWVLRRGIRRMEAMRTYSTDGGSREIW